MRGFEEVGNLVDDYNDKAKEAYRTHASLYLDFVDDNMSHFTWRDIDIRPLENAQVEHGDSEAAYKAYMAEAREIAMTALEDYYKGDKDQLYADYPMLKQYDDELLEQKKHEWYQTSDGWFTYYVNTVTHEKKLHLEEGDIEVPSNIDDFYRG